MNYIILAALLIIIIGGAYFYNSKSKSMDNSPEIIQEVIAKNKSESDTIPTRQVEAEYEFAITGQGRIAGKMLSLAGIEMREVDGVKLPHIVIDNMEDFIYAKKGDIVQLHGEVYIEVIELYSMEYPQIGKVFFNQVQKP